MSGSLLVYGDIDTIANEKSLIIVEDDGPL